MNSSGNHNLNPTMTHKNKILDSELLMLSFGMVTSTLVTVLVLWLLLLPIEFT